MSRADESAQLSVIARAPFQVYFEGTALAVSATNKVGPFDILPNHADFFSVLSPGEVVIETTGEPVTFTIHNGIITVRNNEVMLFADM
jgi:F0F1-type ATP synthase epsilon subunit